MARTLVFAATYNEKDNVVPLVSRIAAAAPGADILIVDDDSPDGTGVVLDDLARSNPRLAVVHRPGKLGLGSAHQLAMLSAMQKQYEFLVTMDADLSHDPADIPRLLHALEGADFVVGSRYMPGGYCDYGGYRRFVSLGANTAARVLLQLPLHEFTTSFRAFRVSALRNVNFLKLRNQGYSFFLESVYRLYQAGFRLAEIPIKFRDRFAGTSKIPRFEIVAGILKLLHLFSSRALQRRMPTPVAPSGDLCANCGSTLLSEWIARRTRNGEANPSASFRCSSMAHASKPRLVKCLQCGLAQVPASEQPKELESIYADVVDDDYLQNLPSKRRTFQRAFEEIRRFIPSQPGSMLEVGAYCGLFLLEAQRNGWQATGIEPSRWAAAFARERSGVSVIDGTLEQAVPKLQAPFDVVVSWDVLEHVRDPGGFLRAAYGLLKPRGILCLSTLDTGNWFPRLMGRHWPWLMEMHLYYFDIDVMKRMLRAAGFEFLHAAPYTHYASLRYIARKLAAALPQRPAELLAAPAKMVPELIVPVGLGDIKMFVARKA
jgi:dolichol-phosphate mannosyltransferase